MNRDQVACNFCLWFFHDCSVRSPVFAAMFESNLAEVQSGTLIINDMSSKAMKELLIHLHGFASNNAGHHHGT
jgi:hypothetical protein